jgi:hypothetical protein
MDTLAFRANSHFTCLPMAERIAVREIAFAERLQPSLSPFYNALVGTLHPKFYPQALT